jgi:putative transcriptional regulator
MVYAKPMPELDPRSLGRRVRQARRERGLTQSALAEAAGVTDETIGRLERGTFEPALSTAAAVAEALGVTLDGLVWPSRLRDVASAPRRIGPPLRRLVARAEVLTPAALRALVRLAELLPTRPREYLPPGEE